MLDQQAFFAHLLVLHPTRRDLVQRLTELLSLSKDAVYRRLRGTTALTTNEFLLLQRHYQVEVGQGQQSGLFAFSFAERAPQTPLDYIEELEKRLDKVEHLANPQLLVAHPGIPFFHEVIFRRLFAFKLYIYGSTCWNIPGWRQMPFRTDVIDQRVLDRARAIGAYAYTVPGRELWTMGILNATIDQIESMQMSGRFADADQPFELLDELNQLVDHLEHMATVGRKFPPGGDAEDGAAFHPAHNELANNDNVILIESDQTKLLFATFITPNFLQTSNQTVVELTRNWFDVIDQDSTSLGPDAGKARNWYFNRLRRQIAHARERLRNDAGIEF